MSVAIFKGKNAKLLTSGELENGDGQVFSKYSERNYIANHSGAVNTSGWTATGTATVTRVTSSVPRATLGYGLQFAAGAAADYVRYRFTVDSADQAKKLKISFDMVPGSYTSGDMKVDLYATSDSSYATGLTRQALSTDASSVTALPNLTGTFRTTFDASSSLIYCELRIVRVSGSSTLTLSDIVVGPGVSVQGAAVTQWQSYTPAISNLTTSGVTGQYRRVGDTLEVNIAATASAAATGGIGFSLPSGYTINTTAIASATSNNALGVALDNHFAGNVYTGTVVYASSTTVQVWTNSTAGTWNGTVPVAGASGDVFTVNFKVPVNELAGSGTVNLAGNDVEYAWNNGNVTAAGGSDTTSFGYGPAGTPILSYNSTTGSSVTSFTIQFQTPISSSDRLVLEINTGSVGWLGVGEAQTAYITQGNASYGTYVTQSSGTSQAIVHFANMGHTPSNVTYAGVGEAWSALSGWKWRVRKERAGAAVGFGIVQPGVSSGLVSASGVPGNAGNAVASGYVGEIKEQPRTSNLAVTGGVLGDIDPGCTGWNTGTPTGLTLTPGVWDIQGTAVYAPAATTTVARVYAAIGTATGGTSTGTDAIRNTFDWNQASASNGGLAITAATPVFRVTISATTTYYLKGYASFATSTMTVTGNIVARRIA